MPINFESALGVHSNALALRSHRAEILASNIVNADTPGYQARDLDFRKILDLETGNGQTLAKTNSKHFQTQGDLGAGNGNELMYRNPLQPSIDGNTVDLQIEQAEYAKNALRFQASFTFLNSKVRGVIGALKGE